MEARAPQCLVGKDVADAGDQTLIEQSGLHTGARRGQPGGEPLDREGVRQRFRAERRQGGGIAAVLAGVDDGDPAEPPGVTQHEDAAVVQAEPDPHMLAGSVHLPGGVVLIEDPDDAGHPQVDDQLDSGRRRRRRPLERQQQELPPAADVGDPASDRTTERADAARRIRVALGIDDGATDDQRSQLAPHGLDLGELRHSWRVMARPSLPSTRERPVVIRREEIVVSRPSRVSRGPGAARVGARDRRADGRPEQERPRDRTGRPLPYGTSDVPLVERIDPATVEQALELGVQRWDDRRYFECHEFLEFAWKQGPEPDRDLWKGVIQVAVAGVHLQRDNPIGARRLLDRALGRLSGQPPVHRGIDVDRLRGIAEAALARLDAGDRPEADWGAFPSCPDGGADGVWFAATADATGPSGHPTSVV